MSAETMICPHCARPCPEGADFCQHCRAPLSTHATTDPMGSIFAEGFAVRQAVSQPRSKLVVAGVWMWLLPLFLFSTGIVFFGFALLAAMLVGAERPEFANIVGAFVCLGLGSLLMYISGSILYRSTMSYLEAKDKPRPRAPVRPTQPSQHISAAPIHPKPRGDEDEDVEDDGDNLKCLACGHRMTAQSAECPACGWSYHQ